MNIKKYNIAGFEHLPKPPLIVFCMMATSTPLNLFLYSFNKDLAIPCENYLGGG